MKITQSIVVASLSVAAHSSVASPVRDFSPQNLISPRAAKVALAGARAPRMNARRLGRRAPSLPVALAPHTDLPDNESIQPELPVSNAVASATGAGGGLRAVSGPLSGPVGGVVSKVLGTAGTTLKEVPVVGDLAKALPLDSLGQGDPLASIINVASNTVSGLPAVGGPLADTLNSTATLTQALPLSLEIIPESRAAVLPSYPFHQLPVAAHELTMAGGAFPIQPSRSLDGLTLPNEQIGPESLYPKYTGYIDPGHGPQENSHVKTQQEPGENTQVQSARNPEEDDEFHNSESDSNIHSQAQQESEEDSQVQSARYPEEDDEVHNSENDSHIHSQAQQGSEEDSQVQSARYPDENDQVPGTENDSQVHSQELPQEPDSENDDQVHSQELPQEQEQPKPSNKLSSALPADSHIPPSGFVPDFLTSAFDHSLSPPLELSFPTNHPPAMKNLEKESTFQNRKLSPQHLKKWWKAKASSIAKKISRPRY